MPATCVASSIPEPVLNPHGAIGINRRRPAILWRLASSGMKSSRNSQLRSFEPHEFHLALDSLKAPEPDPERK